MCRWAESIFIYSSSSDFTIYHTNIFFLPKHGLKNTVWFTNWKATLPAMYRVSGRSISDESRLMSSMPSRIGAPRPWRMMATYVTMVTQEKRAVTLVWNTIRKNGDEFDIVALNTSFYWISNIIIIICASIYYACFKIDEKIFSKYLLTLMDISYRNDVIMFYLYNIAMNLQISDA